MVCVRRYPPETRPNLGLFDRQRDAGLLGFGFQCGSVNFLQRDHYDSAILFVCIRMSCFWFGRIARDLMWLIGIRSGFDWPESPSQAKHAFDDVIVAVERHMLAMVLDPTLVALPMISRMLNRSACARAS